MIITGTVVNALAVIGGSVIGMLFRKALPERIVKTIIQTMGLFTIFLGVKMALGTEEVLLMIFSLVAGAVIGEWIDLEAALERFSRRLKKWSGSSSVQFTEGFITAFLLFCMGSMTILGAIEEGLGGAPDLLLTKSVMDGFSSIALASALGIGVLFSSVPLFLYQAGLTLFAFWLQGFLSDGLVTEISAVGGVLLIGLGISISGIKKIKVINMIPALVIIVVLYYFFA
jgi:uncharacterized membrane protein YqgA involved in biofilm formation